MVAMVVVRCVRGCGWVGVGGIIWESVQIFDFLPTEICKAVKVFPKNLKNLNFEVYP